MITIKQLQEAICTSRSLPETMVTPNATLEGDLSLDSLDVVDLIMDLEKEFKVDIPEEDAQKLVSRGTIQQILDYLNGSREFVDSFEFAPA